MGQLSRSDSARALPACVALRAKTPLAGRSIPTDGCEGFSIAEMLIASLILGVIAAQVGLVVVSSDRTQSESARKVEAMDVTRAVIDVISGDARNAGFMVPRHAAVSAVDGGTAAADRLCVSSVDYFDLPNAPGAASALDVRTARFEGARVSSVVSTTLDIDLASSLDVDGFGGGNDFVPGEGIIIAQSDGAPTATFPAKGIATYCARIESVDVASQRIRLILPHAVPSGLFVGTANIIAVPAHVYEVDAGGITRNSGRLSTLVEDLQVELWVDSSGVPNGKIDGVGEFPIHDLGAMPQTVRDSARIRRVRITVVARGAVREERSGLLFRPAAANRVAGAEDGFSRQTLTASLLPRNLLEIGAYGEVP